MNPFSGTGKLTSSSGSPVSSRLLQALLIRGGTEYDQAGTMLLMNGLVADFNFACQIAGRAEPFSVQMYLPMPDGRTTLANFFSPLVHNMEKMFLTGKEQYPVERSLLTSGLLIAGTDSAFQGMKRLQTPNLAAVHYQPNPASTYWRS